MSIKWYVFWEYEQALLKCQDGQLKLLLWTLKMKATFLHEKAKEQFQQFLCDVQVVRNGDTCV